MRSVKAAQHIYTSVEQELSPQGMAGFQTLAFSRSLLSKAEAEQMESRLVYFSSESQPVKRVFFRTSKGNVVLSQIVPLAETDSAGRQGLYMAHSLIFSPTAFARLGSNPFSVFSSFRFAIALEDAREMTDLRTGDIPPARICSQPTRTTEVARRVGKWEIGELKKLVRLAIRARVLEGKPATVALVGSPSQVEESLSVAFFAVPVALRHWCSFDTCFDGCNLVGTDYWAVGLTTRPRGPKFLVVDCSARKVEKGLANRARHPYERWVEDALSNCRLSPVFAQKERAFALSQYLDGKREEGPLLRKVPQPVVAPIFQADSAKVAEKIRSNLKKVVPHVLADRMAEEVARTEHPYQLLQKLLDGFPLPDLLDHLYRAYLARGFSIPPEAEQTALCTILAGREHPKLAALLALWNRQVNLLQPSLASLHENEYRQFVETALPSSIMKPHAFVIPDRGGVFVQAYMKCSPAPAKHLCRVVSALISAGETECLPLLRRYLPALSWWQRWNLTRRVKQDRRLPDSFRNALCGTKKRPPCRR